MTILEPFEFQKRAIEKAAGHGQGQYISFPCGTGKTITSIEVVKANRANGIDGPTLVLVAPKVVVPQWLEALRAQDPGVPIERWNSADDVRTLGRNDRRYIVMHYDNARFAMDDLPKWRYQPWANIIADEAHNLKNHQAQRFRLTRFRPERVFPMSATPIQASPADVWTLLHWLDRQQFSSYHRFVAEYVHVVDGYNGHPKLWGMTKDPVKQRELQAIMQEYMIRIKKKDAAPWLPEKVVTHVPIELEGAQRELYKRIQNAKDFVVPLQEFAADGADPLIITQRVTQIMRLLQAASEPSLVPGARKDINSAKREWLDAYVADNPDEQMVVFTQFREVAIAAAKRYKGALIVGQREPKLLDEFRKGNVQVLCGTIGAMGTALDLPKPRTAIFVDSIWSTIQMEQAMERIDRITPGRTEPKHIIYLEAQRTVDRLVRKALEGKWSEAQLVYAFVAGEYE